MSEHGTWLLTIQFVNASHLKTCVLLLPAGLGFRELRNRYQHILEHTVVTFMCNSVDAGYNICFDHVHNEQSWY